jgi:hypothetical protein
VSNNSLSDNTVMSLRQCADSTDTSIDAPRFVGSIALSNARTRASRSKAAARAFDLE